MAAPDTIRLRLLQRLCYDLLQRGPSANERRSYVGADKRRVVERLLRSREAMQEWLEEQLYYFLLLDRFRPGGEAIEGLPLRLQRGEATAADAIAEILRSTGFSLRNPGNDTFVSVVLEQCLGYRVQDKKTAPILEAGKKAYDGKRSKFLGNAAQSQSDVVRIALQHEDFVRCLLDRHSQRLLGGPAPDLDAATARVLQDGKAFFDVVADWLASPAYEESLQQRKAKSERQFLRGLYFDVLERTPSDDDLRNLRNAMSAMADPAPLRSVLAKVLLDSKDAKLPPFQAGQEQDFVAQCFERYLLRAPNPKEAEAFAAALRQGAAPAMVVRALCGSLEYQTC